jgi:hypothetical protein
MVATGNSLGSTCLLLIGAPEFAPPSFTTRNRGNFNAVTESFLVSDIHQKASCLPSHLQGPWQGVVLHPLPAHGQVIQL